MRTGRVRPEAEVADSFQYRTFKHIRRVRYVDYFTEPVGPFSKYRALQMQMGPLIQRINATLVILELALIVLPAAALHGVKALGLIFVLAYPPLLLAYFVGWWALGALFTMFFSFTRSGIRPGLATYLGLVAGCVTVSIILWNVITGTPSCSTCKPPEFFSYRPELLCIAVALHWSFLHFREFRLTFNPSGPSIDVR